jgi:hypothetical protein
MVYSEEGEDHEVRLLNLVIIIAALGWSVLEKKLTLVYLFFAFLVLMLIGSLWGHMHVVINRRRGIYPQKGQETMDDVKRLALSGNKTFAIDVYRAIQGADLRTARREVDKIINSTDPADKD